MTENNPIKTIDDLLDNPFDFQEPLLPKEMQTEKKEAETSLKLIDRLSPEEREKAKVLHSKFLSATMRQSLRTVQMLKASFQGSPLKCSIMFKAKILDLLEMY